MWQYYPISHRTIWTVHRCSIRVRCSQAVLLYHVTMNFKLIYLFLFLPDNQSSWVCAFLQKVSNAFAVSFFVYKFLVVFYVLLEIFQQYHHFHISLRDQTRFFRTSVLHHTKHKTLPIFSIESDSTTWGVFFHFSHWILEFCFWCFSLMFVLYWSSHLMGCQYRSICCSIWYRSIFCSPFCLIPERSILLLCWPPIW